jgi:folate-binding protein YgfZ
MSVDRFGRSGHDIWCESHRRDEIKAELSQDFRFCDEGCAEPFRIKQGIPRWGCELTAEIIPVEANLEQRCIDYEKGCYIGQETISRMKMSGQRNKNLCGLVSVSGAPLEPNARLTTETDPIKDAGWITSATKSARLGKEIGLGYVKRGHNVAGSRLRSGDIPVEIAELPFV